jgi:hypothetical protein
MVSSSPITTGARGHEDLDQQKQQIACRRARRPRRAVEDTVEGAEAAIALTPQDTQHRRDGAPASSTRPCLQVGRVNRSAKTASRSANLALLPPVGTVVSDAAASCCLRQSHRLNSRDVSRT